MHCLLIAALCCAVLVVSGELMVDVIAGAEAEGGFGWTPGSEQHVH